MIALLLRLYPARWRERYGSEFAAILGDRPLGPYDVADVLLGALDAHLHLRGLGAASQHGRGFPMSLRLGGWSAIAAGTLWVVAFVWSLAMGEGAGALGMLLILAATVLVLLALAGLSAFQARRHPALAWVAFLVPAAGACVSLAGIVAMAVVGDRPFVGGASPWYLWMLGVVGLIVGSALFALVTWRVEALSRPAAMLLGLGSLAVVPALAGISGGSVPSPLGEVVTLLSMLAFAGGWIALGISALRIDRTASVQLRGALP